MKLALGHFVANLALLGLGYYWLGIGMARQSQLVWNAAVALGLIVIACCAYGAVFGFYASGERKLVSPAWKSAVRNLAPLVLFAIAVLVVYWLMALWQDYSSNPAFTLASFLTLTFRKPVKPASVSRVLDAVLWVVRFAVLPVLLLPMLAAIAAQGWRGFGAAGSRVKRWWFWIVAPVLLWVALRLPFAILGWKPTGQFVLEMMSLILRALAAYLVFVVGWLVLAFATSAGKPRLTQPSTADSV